MKKRLFIILAVVLAVLAILTFALVKIGPMFNLYVIPPTPQSYVKIALEKMKNGIYAEGVEWERAKEDAMAKAKDCTTFEETYGILREALHVAGGKHSNLITVEKQQLEVEKQEMPTVSFDSSGILSIVLPPYTKASNRFHDYVSAVTSIVKENEHAIKGVVIDLRDNTGGDMNPMLAAISPFLPDDKPLAFNAKGYVTNVKVPHENENDVIRITGVPVAILQNELTASSGEVVLLSFRGLDNAKTFGNPSAGFCSCNVTFYLYDGALMLLTVGTDVARTGEEFCEDPIQPDVLTDDPEGKAREWLLMQMTD